MPGIADPFLLEQLEDLDRGVFDSLLEPGSFVDPPPLLDRLAIPQPRGQWRQMYQSDVSSHLIPDTLSAGKLEELDRGLVQGPDTSESALSPHRTARAPLPEEVVQNRPARSSSSDAISEWIISAYLVLLMLAGATGAALAFHDRLSAVVVQWEARLK